jgi:hypothetical protein
MLDNIRKHAAKFVALGTVLGFAAGYIWTDFNSFRDHNRQLVAQEMVNVQQSAETISVLLHKFADHARGVREVDQDTVDELRSVLSRLLDHASTLKNRVPSSEPEFEEFAGAMVTLKNTAEAMEGPLDGQDFVEAVSEFYRAKDEFERAIIRDQSEYQLINL